MKPSLFLFPFLLVGGAGAEDLTTVNTGVSRLWQKVDSRAGPITVLSFGDSMADSYRSVAFFAMRKFEARLGTAGYALNNYQNKLMWVLTNGATFSGPSSIWFCQHSVLPPGAGVWWETQWATGVYGNRAGVFIVAQPNGGSATVSISTNGGPWSYFQQVNTSNSTPTALFIHCDLPPNFYRIRVDSTTGTNFVIGPQVVHTGSTGVQIVFMDQPGIPLSSIDAVPRSIRDPVLAALRPDLTLWHMKEGTSSSESNSLVAHEQWWQSANPDGEVIYIGTPWTQFDGSLTIDQNKLVRSVAVANGRGYCDLMQPSVNYDWLRTNGFILADGVHLSSLGGEWGANLLWNDFGLFALATPRQLDIALANGRADVSFATEHNLNYCLLRSTGLVNWIVQTNIVGDGSIHTHTLQDSSATFFKLQITQP